MMKRSCDKRLITLYRLRICLAGMAFLLLFSAAALVFAGGRAAPLLFVIILSAGTFVPAALLLPRYWYDRLSYMRNCDWLLVECGLLCRRRIIVPRSRMQYIAVKRSFLERSLGLCTLELSSGGSVVRLPGLPPKDAGQMKALLEGRGRYRNAI